MKTLLSLAFSAAILSGSSQAQTGGPWSITAFTIDSGGGTSSGGGWTLTGTIGQADASPATATGGPFALQGGFWAEPGVLPTENGGPQLTLRWVSGQNFVLEWPAEAKDYYLIYTTNFSTWTFHGARITGAGSLNWPPPNWPAGDYPRMFFMLTLESPGSG